MYYIHTIHGAPYEATHNTFLDHWGFFLSLTVCRFSLLMLYTNLDLFCNRCITNKCSGSSDYFKIMCVFV